MKIKSFYLGGLLGFPNIFKIGVSLNTGKRKSQLSNGVRFIMFYEIALGKIILNGRLEYLADIIEKEAREFGKGHAVDNKHDWFKSKYIFKYMLPYIESRLEYYTSYPSYFGPKLPFISIQNPNRLKNKPIIEKVPQAVPNKSLHRKDLFGNKNYYQSIKKKVLKPDPRQLRFDFYDLEDNF